MIFDPKWLPLLLAEISNGKKKNQLETVFKFSRPTINFLIFLVAYLLSIFLANVVPEKQNVINKLQR
jgi:hypothetical protein